MANSKQKLTRLELALMGKGPVQTAIRQMRKAAESSSRSTSKAAR